MRKGNVWVVGGGRKTLLKQGYGWGRVGEAGREGRREVVPGAGPPGQEPGPSPTDSPGRSPSTCTGRVGGRRSGGWGQARGDCQEKEAGIQEVQGADRSLACSVLLGPFGPELRGPANGASQGVLGLRFSHSVVPKTLHSNSSSFLKFS